MNMLCGIIEQTSGEILMYNRDTRAEMEDLRRLIGYCPQRIYFCSLIEMMRGWIRL